MGSLVVVGGNDRGKQYALANPQTAIGRGADQDLVLADIAVSRRHVVIVIDVERYRLKDLGSGNGTLINGVRTATALLNDGDQIEIGNTLLRFDHPPSALQAPPPAAAPASVPQAGAQQRTMIADAAYPAPQPPPGYAMGQPMQAPEPFAGPQETPSDVIPSPPSRASVPMPIMTGAHPSQGQRGGLLDTPVKKAAVFGTLGVVVLVAGVLVVGKVMGGGKAQADKLFAEGTTAFKAGDYEGAKKLFTDALKAEPSSPQAKKYSDLCDVEIHAKGALKTAQDYARGKKWDDELKVLDSIDKSSVSYDDAEKLRKQAVPEAIKSYLADAREAMADDKDTAKQKIEAALLLDPDNSDAQELEQRLKSGGADSATAAGGKEPKGKEPKVARGSHHEARAAVAAAPPAPVKKHGSDDDDEDGGSVAVGGGGGDLMSNHAAAGPYRARDFNGAATALRLQAKSQKGSAASKTIALASQVARLGDLYARAEADKGRNPVQAVQEYQQAMSIDGSVGHGTHAAYFKGQSGKLAKDAARQAYSQSRFDVAFEMAKAAQRLTGDDGGVGAQLRAKANDFNNKANAMLRSNPNGAKTMWRTVLKMVPPNDPAYIAATRGLSSSSAAKDEDED